MKYLALLRGINLGSKNRLAMKDLRDLFMEVGCERVQTFIQSGNVIFDASPMLAAKLPKVIGARLQASFSLRIPLILRTAYELSDTLLNNPFLKSGAAEDAVHLMFLSRLPDPAAVSALDPDRSPPHQFAVRGKDVYLHTPNGFQNTRLTNAWFDSKLNTISTVRNWRTSLKLYELMTS